VTRIVWSTTSYGAEIGTVGQRRLFTIEDNSAATQRLFVLRTDLPGGPRSWKSRKGPDGLKAHAEKVLAEFISNIGAVFPS
jgi:hypothetical protein